MKNRIKPGRSLYGRLVGGSVFFVILFTAVIGAFSYFLVREVVRNNAKEKLIAIAVVKEDNLNRWVDEQRRNVVFIATLPEVRRAAGDMLGEGVDEAARAQARDILARYFRSVVTVTSDSQEILLLDPNGLVVVSSTEGHVGTFQGHEPYFQKGYSQTYVTSFYSSVMLGTPTLTISTPMFNASGQRVGVLASHTNLASVDILIRDNNNLGKTTRIYLVNTDRRQVTSDPLVEIEGQFFHSIAVDLAIQKQDGADLYLNHEGIPVVGAYLWNDERDVVLLVETQQTEIFSQLSMLAWVILLAGSTLLMVSFLLINFMSQRITSPIETLTHTASRIAAGNFELSAPIQTDDEIGELARAFNAMTDRLRVTMIGLENLNRDLEERVAARTAELENSVKELGSFSYSVSHDLRAPLRAISSYANILYTDHKDSLDEDARRMLKYVVDNAIMMGRLVDDLLAFSRLGRQSMHLQPISEPELRSLIQQVVDELRTGVDFSNVPVEILPLPPCQADPNLLKQVFANLISNAVKFSHKRVNPHVQVGSGSTGQGVAYFVRDNGVGFDMKYADKLFGVFQRLHRQEDFEGTGVGLAIVQRIIHRHGGQVWAESTPEQGATFYFTLGGSHAHVTWESGPS